MSHVRKGKSVITSLSIGDDAKVGASNSRSRFLYVYLRLYTFINVFIRINTAQFVDNQCVVFFLVEKYLYRLLAVFSNFCRSGSSLTHLASFRTAASVLGASCRFPYFICSL